MAHFFAVAYKIVALTPSASAFANGRTYGILVGTGGTADITDADGNDLNSFPLQSGYNPISLTKLRALGTAANVYALYEKT